MLTTDGFEVTVAGSGAEALLKLEEGDFDVVVCDYLMPKMDGIELLKKVRANTNYTPFIFFSGNADDSHEVKMIGQGAYQLLSKTQVSELVPLLHKTIKFNEGFKNLNGLSDVSDDFLKMLNSTRL